MKKRLPGWWLVYVGVPINEAIACYKEKIGLNPDVVGFHTSYRLNDDEAAALREANAQFVQMAHLHGVWCGPCPE